MKLSNSAMYPYVKIKLNVVEVMYTVKKCIQNYALVKLNLI